MAIELSTAGILTKWAPETAAGTMPTTGWKTILDVTELPDMNSQPETMECTTLAEQLYKKYIPGLKDTGGALALTCNMTDRLKEEWADIVDAYEIAQDGGKALWMIFEIPGIDEAFGFTFQPTPLGFSGATVNSVLTTSVYVTMTNEPDWVAKPA